MQNRAVLDCLSTVQLKPTKQEGRSIERKPAASKSSFGRVATPRKSAGCSEAASSASMLLRLSCAGGHEAAPHGTNGIFCQKVLSKRAADGTKNICYIRPSVTCKNRCSLQGQVFKLLAEVFLKSGLWRGWMCAAVWCWLGVWATSYGKHLPGALSLRMIGCEPCGNNMFIFLKTTAPRRARTLGDWLYTSCTVKAASPTVAGPSCRV